jgi:hypothetical protein
MSDEPFESPKWFWPATGFGIGANAGQCDVMGGQVHIANIDFPAFYAEAAGGPSAAHSFVRVALEYGVAGETDGEDHAASGRADGVARRSG